MVLVKATPTDFQDLSGLIFACGGMQAYFASLNVKFASQTLPPPYVMKLNSPLRMQREICSLFVLGGEAFAEML